MRKSLDRVTYFLLGCLSTTMFLIAVVAIPKHIPEPEPNTIIRFCFTEEAGVAKPCTDIPFEADI